MVLLSAGSELLRPSRSRALQLALRLSGLRGRRHGGFFALPGCAWIVLDFPRSFKRIPSTHFLKRLWFGGWDPGHPGARRPGGLDIEQGRCLAKTVPAALSLGDLEAALPRLEFALVSLLATALLDHTFRGPIVVEREVQIEVEVVPNGLPNPCPVKRVCLVAILKTSLLGSGALTSLLSS